MPDETKPDEPTSSAGEEAAASNPPQAEAITGEPAAAAPAEAPTADQSTDKPSPGALSQAEVEAAMQALLDSAEDAKRTGADPAAAAAKFESPNFKGAEPGSQPAALELLDDVELDVKVELGRTELYIEDILKLGVGSVVELDKLAGDPVDIYVNERLVARGEVLVLNESFCVRVNDIVNPIPDVEL